MHIYDFPSAEDWEWEGEEEPIQVWEIAKQRLFIQEASKLNSYPLFLKRNMTELILKPEERVREGPEELPPQCWAEILRCSKVSCVYLSFKGNPAEPFLNSLSTDREKGFPALLMKPFLRWNQLSLQPYYSSRRLQGWIRRDLQSFVPERIPTGFPCS